MPDADFPCLVVGAKSGHVRNNKAWVVGRLLRDMEASADELLRKREAQHPAETRRVTNQVSTIVKSDWEALRVYVYVYRNEPGSQSGVPDRDWVCYMGFVVIAAQLALSVVPWALYASWGTFVVTVGGTFLSTFTSSLAQWADEKWACPRTSVTVTVTRGNGCRQASIILGAKDTGLDLEVLATGTRNALSSRLTKFVIPTLSIAWIILLICVAGMRDHSWCMRNSFPPKIYDC
jgi:low affinity Fe/Cu permease